MTITAKYPGHCRRCGQQIIVGQQIEWVKGSPAVHTTCPPAAAPTVDPTPTPVPVDRPTIDQSTRLGRMLAAGRLEATFTFPNGQHRTYTFRCLTKSHAGWDSAPFGEASHCFIDYGSWPDKVKVARIDATGKVTPDRFADDTDVCAVAAIYTVALTGIPNDVVAESSKCGACGRKLTDPVSIDRGIGPECYGKMTGSKSRPVACDHPGSDWTTLQDDRAMVEPAGRVQ